MKLTAKSWQKPVSVFMALIMLFSTSIPPKTLTAEETPITPPLILSGNQSPMDARYEVASLRTPTSRTYEISPGSYISEIYSEPIAYQNSRGQLQTIDNTLIADQSSADTWLNTVNTYTARLSSSLDTPWPVIFEHSGVRVSMKPHNLTGTGSVQDSSIHFPDAAASTDYTITAENSGIRQDITLKAHSGQNQFTWAFAAEGLDIISRQGSIYLLDQKTDGLMAVLTTPTAQDNAGHICEDMTTTLDSLGNAVVSINPDWLTGAVYPVTISPRLSLVTDSHLDISLKQSTDSTSNTLNGQCYIGYDDGIASGRLAAGGTAHQQTRTYIYPALPASLISPNHHQSHLQPLHRHSLGQHRTHHHRRRNQPLRRPMGSQLAKPAPRPQRTLPDPPAGRHPRHPHLRHHPPGPVMVRQNRRQRLQTASQRRKPARREIPGPLQRHRPARPHHRTQRPGPNPAAYPQQQPLQQQSLCLRCR